MIHITNGEKMNHGKRDKIRVIMHALADQNNYNAQNLNAREIAYRLNPDKFDVTLFYEDKPDPRLVNRENIHLIKLPKNKVLSSFIVLKKYLTQKYDIFFYVRISRTDYIYLKMKKIFNDRRITIHIIENKLPYPGATKRYNKIAKANALNSDYVFSVSKYVAETAEKEYGIKTSVMYVGVDTSLFVPPKEKNHNSKVKILYVGSFQERKRPYLVLEAAKYFPDAEFHLIGNGPLRDRLLFMKKSEKLYNVYIHGEMPQKNLIPYHQNSDIFLFPSIHEGFPKVTIEAASCGLPAIVFDNYKPETVLDGKTGFIVKDFQEMLNKLEILINNPNLRNKMGKNAREYAKNFNWDVIVKKWEKIFLDAVRKNEY